MKLGLALSGGGFRAAMFHVGVLAQMARLGLLRHVEVISTVSGGSTIGALYYLKVKLLVERKRDQDIEDVDYVKIVLEIERDFLRVIQRNLRTRTFLNPVIYLRRNNLFYIFSGEQRRVTFKRGGVFTRTDRLGELLDEHLYRPALGVGRPVRMRDLRVALLGVSAEADAETQNQSRSAKIPTVLINATVLNSGHNWRFESRTMGESERLALALEDIDRNLRLCRPPSYEAMPARFCDLPLGRAVAASAAVPGLFPPVSIRGLYPEEIWVELVDGGVHDNQGIQGLIDLKCTHFVVSDGSGQMEDDPDPPIHAGAVLNRTSSVLMDRLREEQLLRLIGREGSSVAFIHLKKGLPPRYVPWIGPDERAVDPPTRATRRADASGVGIAREVQELLAKVRTDLDSFTEVEAYSLMLEGYRISEAELREGPGMRDLVRDSSLSAPPRWTFLRIEPWAIRPTPDYLRQLRAAQYRLFKVFSLSWPVTLVTFLVVGIPSLMLALAAAAQLVHEIQTGKAAAGEVFMLFVMTVLVGIAAALSFFGLKTRRFTWLARLAARPPAPGSGTMFIWPFAWLHLAVFDRLFLRQGQLSRLGPPRREGGGSS